MTRLIGLIVLMLAVALPSSAWAVSCGSERARSGGIVFKIRTTGAVCRTGKDVAGRWYRAQSSRVRDRNDRVWRCRITREATGTDPGYNPYTSVRCERGAKVVRFKLRS
jgi:hypothetical protein